LSVFLVFRFFAIAFLLPETTAQDAKQGILLNGIAADQIQQVPARHHCIDRETWNHASYRAR